MCTLNATGQLDKLGERINIAVYRIIQECLTNVTKHADARNVTIDLTGEIDRLLLRIEDDGSGMPVTAPAGGLGLIGMRERVEALSGVFRTGMAAKGFLIEIAIPLQGGNGVQV